MSNLFNDKLSNIHSFGKINGISQEALNYLSEPEFLMTVSLPVRMDTGAIKVFRGYRSRYSTLLGPAKGGIRFHPLADSNVVNGLALSMMVKNSLAGLPYGGGKGGVVVDTNTISKGEKERISRAYIRAIYKNIGPYLDVPAPDVATDAFTMGIMVDEYESILGYKAPAVITGKPLELGGSIFRTEATGFGVFLTTKLFTQKLKKIPKNTTIAVQGFGNLGLFLSKFLYEEGFKVVALSDIKGGIYCEDGINVLKLIENLGKSQAKVPSIIDSSVNSFIKNIKIINNEEILELPVDILIPAAIDDVITEKNADNIQAQYIVEGANSPISVAACEILDAKKKLVVPDIIANSGGVIVSYFEWVQNIQCYKWSLDTIKLELSKIIEASFNKVWELYEKEGGTLRNGAWAISLKRLESSFRSRYYKN